MRLRAWRARRPTELKPARCPGWRRYTRSRARARERGFQRRHVREQCRIMSVHGSLTRGCCSVFKAEVLRRPKVPKATEHRRCRSTSNSYIYRRVFHTGPCLSHIAIYRRALGACCGPGGEWRAEDGQAGVIAGTSSHPARALPRAALADVHLSAIPARAGPQSRPVARRLLGLWMGCDVVDGLGDGEDLVRLKIWDLDRKLLLTRDRRGPSQEHRSSLSSKRVCAACAPRSP